MLTKPKAVRIQGDGSSATGLLGTRDGPATREKVVQFLGKLNIHLPCDLAIPRP